MRTSQMHITSQGAGIAEALTEVEFAANRSGIGDRQAMRIRLIAEEMMEMVRSVSRDFEAEFSAQLDGSVCELKLLSDTTRDGAASHDVVSLFHRSAGVTGKIRSLMQSPFSELQKNEELLGEFGIRKVEPELFDGMMPEDAENAYVWTLESYGLSAFDALIADDDENWVEIARSIIANLADDFQMYIYEDRLELTVLKDIGEDEPKRGADSYAIAPEFEALWKVPVPKSRFQVRIVQLMYRHLEWRAPVSRRNQVERTRIPAASSKDESLHALVYSPAEMAEDQTAPCVLFLHGGAFLFPAMPYHYRLANTIAKRISCRVIMPMYDLAPDTVPPQQQEEIFEAYCHLLKHSTWYHIDPDNIVVIGDSAGGTLAAALCLMARERGVTMPVGQALFYPSLDRRLASDSMKRYTDVPVCNGDSIRSYYKLCRSDEYEGNPDYISPVEAQDVSGLPRAYIETAEFDALHDDGIAYARRLRQAGNPVILNETRGTVHAFDMAKKSRILRKAMEQRIAFIRDVLQAEGVRR